MTDFTLIYKKIFCLYGLCLGLYIGIIFFNNVTQYDANFEYVRHIMSMSYVSDTGNVWRAIDSNILHHCFYLFIIFTELIIAACLISASVLLYKSLSNSWGGALKSNKLSFTAMCLGVLLFFIGFLVVGGEFFLSYEATKYNSVYPGMRMLQLFTYYILMHIPFIKAQA